MTGMEYVMKTLSAALREGDLGALERCLDEHPELGTEPVDASLLPEGCAGWYLLHLAAFHGQAEVERHLIARGANPSALNAEGRTALHVALEYNNTTRDVLLELGVPQDPASAAALNDVPLLADFLAAAPELVDDLSTGLSPLGWAAYFGSAEAGRFLLERGARRDGEALHCAAQVNGVTFGRLLLEHGFDPDRRLPSWGCTALHAAAGMRYTKDARKFVTLLLQAGADPGALDALGRTALEIAETGAAGSSSEESRLAFTRLARLLRG
jgi:ankyrin repeat protein